tara:strand:- start:101 stop:436 length:336 start_codon:yes stop_codon:yes gene_type:complete
MGKVMARRLLNHLASSIQHSTLFGMLNGIDVKVTFMVGAVVGRFDIPERAGLMASRPLSLSFAMVLTATWWGLWLLSDRSMNRMNKSSFKGNMVGAVVALKLLDTSHNNIQ